jgi:hypothetical protein
MLLVLLAIGLMSVVLAFMAGWGASGVFYGAEEKTIAMSWGDGRGQKNYYGAQVYLVPGGFDGRYSVRAIVRIGPGNGYVHDCGELGRAATEAEAVEKWGKITWKEEGLFIGDPDAGGYHLPRARMESHR